MLVGLNKSEDLSLKIDQTVTTKLTMQQIIVVILVISRIAGE